jgi:hypothetical protein
VVAFKEINKNIGHNGYVDIHLFSGLLAPYLAKRLGHIIRNINTKIVAFQTHSRWIFLNLLSMADKRGPSALYRVFGHMPMNFITPKLTGCMIMGNIKL